MSRRQAATACEACAVRDNTIGIQRAQLTELRRQLAETGARQHRLAEQAVHNLHGLFTVHLAEYTADHFEQLGGDADAPQRIRDYALTFMAECAGLELNQHVTVAYQPDGTGEPVTVPGQVRDVRLSSRGEPVLLVAMYNRGDTVKLVNAGYELAAVEQTGVLAGLLLIVVPFPNHNRRISEGGWIEATS